MKNKSISFLAILVLGGLASVFGAWWWIAVVAAVVCYVGRLSAGASFVLGTAAVTLLWGSYAFGLNAANGGILAGRVAALLGKGVSSGLLLTLTSLIGGFVGGFGAMSGAMIRQTFSRSS